MKKIFLIFIILLFVQCGFGQKFRFGLYAGYNSYALKDLHSIQDELAKQMQALNVEKVVQFPDFIDYSAMVEIKFNDYAIFGLDASFYTTGGKNDVKDYSGEYKMEMLLDGFLLGLHYRCRIYNFEKIEVYSQLKTGIIFTRLKVSESMEIYPASPGSSGYKLTGNSYPAEPSVGLIYDLGHNLKVDFNLGYQMDYNSKLYLNGNKNAWLTTPAGKTAFADWSGLRMSVGVCYLTF